MSVEFLAELVDTSDWLADTLDESVKDAMEVELIGPQETINAQLKEKRRVWRLSSFMVKEINVD